MIHPTALVDKGAKLEDGVTVGPYAVIEDNVRVGAGTTIGAHTVVGAFTEIGKNCRIFHHAAVGGIPQSVKFAGEESWVKIGDNTVVREFVTVHRGTAFGGGITSVGPDNYLMAYTHIAHDCLTGKGVFFANNATLAGHITVGDYATVGGLAAIHQFCRVGDYAFVGGKSAVAKDIPPFVIAAGDRAVLHGLNKVGLRRHGFSEETMDALKRAYRIVFRIGLTLNEAITRVRAQVDQLPEVEKFLEFLESSTRGVARSRRSGSQVW
ncbi:MAG: acyl-ACP--UDP-N-acetylglucosamine O-acyltransferase [Deltaproteobacteria bacterium]|nr:acyl-ACP--UDP-N-acetylglucosamine O-acyltransferase [Deltaproteobacteria bacterium]